MPIDASIYNNIRPYEQPDFIGSATKAATLAGLARQNQEQNDVRSAFKSNIGEDGTINQKGVLSALAKSSNPMQAMEYQSKFSQMNAAQADQQQKMLQDNLNKYSTAYRMASSVKDQPSYDQMKQQMQSMGLPTDHLPPQFDPAHIQDLRTKAAMMTMDAKQGLDAMKGISEIGINEAKAPLERGKLAAEIDKLRSEAGAGKIPNQSQFAAATYGTRAAQAEKVFSDLAAKGFDPTSEASAIGRKLPNWVGGLKSQEVRQQAQAERNFVNAILRRESGAAISKDEFANAEEQYFPRAGDTPEVLLQKEQNRKTVTASLNAEGAPAMGRLNQSMSGIELGSSVAKKDDSGGVMNSANAGAAPKMKAPAGTILMQGPDGKIRPIPLSQKGEAIANGGKVVK